MRKFGSLLALVVFASAPSLSARAAVSAPPMTRASVVAAGIIQFDHVLTTTSQAACWTAVTPNTFTPGAGVFVQGVRTIAEPVQFMLSGCGSESIGGGSGSVWSMFVSSSCLCLVDLFCPPPPSAPCGTYTRTRSQLSVVINNVFVTDGPSPIAAETGPYNGLSFKGKILDQEDSLVGPATSGLFEGSLSYHS